MKLFSPLSLAAGLLSLLAAGQAAAQAPYLETRPVTIHWNFTLTGVSGTTIGKRPLPVDSSGNILGIDDPDKLNPNDRITTEKGSLITYAVGNGEQDFIVKHLVRAVIEDGRYGLSEQDIEGRWELTAVREPQTTVVGAATTPYEIFLTRIEPSRRGGRVSAAYPTSELSSLTVDGFTIEDGEAVFQPTIIPTGLFMTFDQLAGAYSETLSGDRVTRATGTISVAFTINFTSVFADDPRYSAKPTVEQDEFGNDVRVPPVLGKDFHSKVNTWNAAASGVMTAGIRSTAGDLPAVVPTRMKVAAIGSWSHIFTDYSGLPDSEIKTSGFGGIAPLSIKIGEAKFQRRELFFSFR